MKKILNEQVLSELNRMREIMGLSIITEGVIDARTRMILKSLGYTDSYIDNIVGKTVDDLDLDSLADEFATIGVKNSDDLVKKAAAEAGVSSIDDVSEEAILGYIKKNPKIMSSIESKVASMARQAAESSVRNLEASKIFPTDVLDMMKEISDMDLSTPGLSDDLDEIIKFFDDKVVSIGQKGGVVPDELIRLRKQFAEQKKSIESIGANKSKPTIDTGATSGSKAADELTAQLKKEMEEADKKLAELTAKNVRQQNLIKWLESNEVFKLLTSQQKLNMKKTLISMLDGTLTDEQVKLKVAKQITDELSSNATAKQFAEANPSYIKKLLQKVSAFAFKDMQSSVISIVIILLLSGYTLMEILGMLKGKVGTMKDFEEGSGSGSSTEENGSESPNSGNIDNSLEPLPASELEGLN